MQEFIMFMMTFTLLLIIYHVFVIRKAKKGNFEKLPTEVNYIKIKYNVRIDKSNYKKILNMVAIISSFDVALIVTVSQMFESFLLQILTIIVLSPLVFGLTYHLVGKNYQKEGK